MYAGQVVEVAEAKEFFARPLHPYARQPVRRAARHRQARPAGWRRSPGPCRRSNQDFDRLPLRRPLRQRDGPLPRRAAAARRRSRRPRGALRPVRGLPTRPAPVDARLRRRTPMPCRADPPARGRRARSARLPGLVPDPQGAAEAHRRLRQGGRRRVVPHAGRADARAGRRIRAAARRPSARRVLQLLRTARGSAGRRGSTGQPLEQLNGEALRTRAASRRSCSRTRSRR